MAKRIALIGAAIAGFWLYRWCLMWALGHATAMPFPAWWLHVVPRPYGIMVWALMWHTLACVLAGAPYAWLLARYYGRAGLYLACIATLLIAAPDFSPTVRYFGHMSTFARTVTVFDTLKLLLVLPLLVLIFQRSPSNFRWSGP